MSEVTVVLTSCRRHDLLVKSLESFFATNDYPIAEFIIIEDSDESPEPLLLERFPDQPLRVIVNQVNLGQNPSIDRAYAEVRTSLILHLEDDWEFPVPGIVGRAVDVLQTDPAVYLVQLRADTDMPENLRALPELAPGYRRIPPTAHHVWHTFTFNPSLKRLSDYQALEAGYGGFSSEAEVSLHYKSKAAVMAWLSGTGVTHIGWGRSNFEYEAKTGLAGIFQRADRFLSVETLRKWRRSVDRRVRHIRRLLSGHEYG